MARFADSLRTARAQQIAAAIDAADPLPGALLVYTGVAPATKGGAITDQVLLGTLAFALPCAASIVDGVLEFSSLTEDPAADATGTIGWCRVVDGAGAFVMDLTASDQAGNGDVKFNTLSVYEGGPIRVETLRRITEGNA